MPIVRDVSLSRLPAVRAFLEAHLPTSAFLLYSLDRFGPEMGEHRDSGWFMAVEEGGQIVGVTSATRRGHLLVETGRRSDLGDVLLAGLGDRLATIDGVVGEWNAAASVWPRLRNRAGLSVIHETCNVVYVADLDQMKVPRDQPDTVRLLTASDFDIWYPLFHALEEQEGAQIHGSREDVRQRFAVTPWRWHGAFRDSELVAVVCLDLTVAGTGHVGGLYVRAADRRQGFGRAVMAALMRDTQSDARLDQLVLLTREDNAPARHLFERLGFAAAGQFGFLLGTWTERN